MLLLSTNVINIGSILEQYFGSKITYFFQRCFIVHVGKKLAPLMYRAENTIAQIAQRPAK